MSLLTTTSLIVVWCTLEVVHSHLVIPQPTGNQQYILSQPQEPSSYPANAGYQINTTYPGSQDGPSQDDPDQKDGKGYKMFYIEKDQFRCEECDGNGNVRGNMTYLDGKSQRIKTVKYETTEIPLDPNGQDAGNPSQPSQSFVGAQEAYQQPQLIQGQQLPPVQGQPLQTMLQPLTAYQGQPNPNQAQSYQGNQAVFGPLNPLIPQQNPIAPQLPALVAPNQPYQNILGSVQPSSNFASSSYPTASSSSPFFALEKPLPEAVSSGLFNSPIVNRASAPSSQRPAYTSIDELAAEALRNMQPSTPAVQQPLVPSQSQLTQSPALNDGYGNMAQRLNFLNSNGVNDKPEGASLLSSPSYQQSLFSPTSTGVVFNRFQDGGYGFNYKTRDSSRQETADGKNNVVGSYAYRDPNGGIQHVQYTSGVQGFNARDQSIPGAPSPTVMPMILVPTQQPGMMGQQIPFALVAAGAPTTASSSDSDKALPKEEDSAKPSEAGATENMLQQLAKQIVSHMVEEKSGSEGNDNPQPTAEGEQSDTR